MEKMNILPQILCLLFYYANCRRSSRNEKQGQYAKSQAIVVVVVYHCNIVGDGQGSLKFVHRRRSTRCSGVFFAKLPTSLHTKNTCYQAQAQKIKAA